MKKKVLNGILLGVAATLCAGGFAACGKDSAEKTQIEEVYASYVAYAEANGETPLSYEEWLASIKGEKGDKGDKGDDGKSAYEIWLEQGNTGTQEDFLNWLKYNKEPIEDSKISFKTLTVDGTDVTGTVGNATQTFSFLTEVNSFGAAKYTVSKNINGTDPIVSKTIQLSEGDNKVYVLVTIDNDVTKIYSVNIRRKPMYFVSFRMAGSYISGQSIEEGEVVSAPETVPSCPGYTFVKWNFDFSQQITKDTTISAEITANTNTPYKVEYYLQNLENNDYTLQKTENFTGTTGATVNAEIKTFEHFTHTEIPYYNGSRESGMIAGDGSLTLKVYYTRDSYTVTFNGNGGTIKSSQYSYEDCETKTYTAKYGGKVTAPKFMRTGYTQNGWDKELPETISGDITLSAVWNINRYTLTFVYGNGQPDKQITQDYDTAIEVPEEPAARNGYDFGGWNIPKTMPAENRTIYAQWKAIFVLNESGDTITSLTYYYGKNKTELIIPSKIDGVMITSIGDRAFTDCSSLTNITIPDSVTSIGASAFYACSSLTSIMIPNSVTSIGSAVFKDCSSLTSITIPNSVTSIGGSAFYGCWSLENITIPNSVTSIGDSAFQYCSSLTSVTLPNSVTSIGVSAFYGCRSLVDVTLSDAILSIGDSMFRDCVRLQNIIIPERVTSIGKSAFQNCNSLAKIIIPDNVTTISEYSFYQCTSLTSIIIGKSVAIIESWAFSDCYILEVINKSKLYIAKGSFDNGYISRYAEIIKSSGESSVEIAGDLVFCNLNNTVYLVRYCASNSELLLPKSYKDKQYSIYKYAFNNCSFLKTIYYQGSMKEWEAMSIDLEENKDLIYAVRYYYSETKPTESGNFWHYGKDGEIAEW